jgi:mono/diheme cytochrome c family protein
LASTRPRLAPPASAILAALLAACRLGARLRALRARLAVLVMLALAACAPELPDPESAGAQVYRVRCAGCHRLYEPRLLTAAMWEVQLDRMKVEMARRGVNPLTAQERHLVQSYLKAHASDAPAPGNDTPAPASDAPAPGPTAGDGAP